jgi:SAM-dependent methyltransferase
MAFDKYRRLGAYHWEWFRKYPRYRAHVFRVRTWIVERDILDIGAGDGLITFMLNQRPCRGGPCRRRRCRGIDVDPIAVSLAQARGVNVVLGDVYEVTGHYEAVFLGDVLEHLEDPARALRQIAKVTHKLYLTTPPRSGNTPSPYHVQEWTPEELQTFVEGVGAGWRQVSSDVANVRIYALFARDRG